MDCGKPELETEDIPLPSPIPRPWDWGGIGVDPRFGTETAATQSKMIAQSSLWVTEYYVLRTTYFNCINGFCGLGGGACSPQCVDFGLVVVASIACKTN
eukprot:169619-Amphidinium_carterae.1